MTRRKAKRKETFPQGDMNEAAAAADASACSQTNIWGCRDSLVRREGGFSVNQLRQLMLEELQRRNFAETTIRCYLHGVTPVSYTHLRAHETDSYLVCRLLLEK